MNGAELTFVRAVDAFSNVIAPMIKILLLRQSYAKILGDVCFTIEIKIKWSYLLKRLIHY